MVDSGAPHAWPIQKNGVRTHDRCKTTEKFDVRKEGCEARIDVVDDDDEHEKLGDREAVEDEFGSRDTGT